jgi:hypothetical protein
MSTHVSRLDAEKHIREFYEQTWRDWYGVHGHPKPAKLIFHWDESGTTHYRKSTDEIHLSSDDGDCENIAAELAGQRWSYAAKLGWYAWKTFLVHEMLHEYQYKVVLNPTPAGESLLGQFAKRNFEGAGHDAVFYSAIADRATYFGVTPE